MFLPALLVVQVLIKGLLVVAEQKELVFNEISYHIRLSTTFRLAGLVLANLELNLNYSSLD